MSNFVRDLLLLDGPITPAFVPTSIAGLQLWLDASDASSVTLDGSNNVEQWDDKSGNVRHAVQATALSRPAYTSAAVNGLNALTFNGTSHRLTTGAFTVNQPHTVLIVTKAAVNTSFRVMLDSAGPRCAMYNSGGTATAYTAGTDRTAAVTVGTSARLYTAIFNGASSSLRFDRVSVSTANPGTNALGGGMSIGSGPGALNFWSGEICEILVYNSALSGADLTNVESYMSTKWGTA